MMQYHYVVGYDTEQKKWFVDQDVDAYFSDGSVWDNDKSESSDWIVSGWFTPEEGSAEKALDYNLLKTLGYIVDTFPIPQEA
jgi:hypothetical protein